MVTQPKYTTTDLVRYIISIFKILNYLYGRCNLLFSKFIKKSDRKRSICCHVNDVMVQNPVLNMVYVRNLNPKTSTLVTAFL